MKNSVTEYDIQKLLDGADIITKTAFGKCTIVIVQLANGFVITESSACVDPINYDEEMGRELCLSKIKDKLWELEGYYLQKELIK